MEVEEDPSSQFVDFTNATALEQFASDLEQVLIAWQLANKGHASREALAAAFPPAFPGDDCSGGSGSGSGSSAGAAGPAVWTRVVEFARSPSVFYTLSLFVGPSLAAQEPGEDVRGGGQTWQAGAEHFTPTMLALSDAARDFRPASSSADAMASSLVFDGADDAVLPRAVLFDKVRQWLGIGEFLFLSRSTQQEIKKAPQSDRHKPRGVGVDATGVGGTPRETQEGESDAGGGSASPAMEDPAGLFGVDGVADVAIDQNESGVLLSALMIALNNLNCTLPAFVPVSEPSRGTWIGSAVPGETGNVSIAFETDSVPELNPNQSCISGLLDFFKLKLQLPPQVEEQCRLAAEDRGHVATGMTVSASFGYAWTRGEDPREDAAVDTAKNPADWSEFMSHLALSRPAHVQQASNNVFGARMRPVLGPTSSSLAGFDLKVGWPNLREGTYVDNVVHSTLDPQTAPDWTLRAHFRPLVTENARKPSLPLSKMVANLVQAYSNSKELSKDILVSELAPNIHDYPSQPASSTPTATPPPSVGKEDSAEGRSFASNSRLHDSIPASRAAAVIGSAIGSIISAATWKAADVEEIRRVVAELFDQEDSARAAGECMPSASGVQHGAPVGQLVSILACRMGQLHGINSMALLWVEFVKGLRERWFQQKLLPFMSTAVDNGLSSHNGSSTSLTALFLLDSDAFQLPQPDFHQCLLHQKLQLLNCCILREAEVVRSQQQQSHHASPPSQVTMTELTAFMLDDEDGEEETESHMQVQDVDEGSPSDDEFFDSVEQHESPRQPSQPAASATSQGGLRTIPGVECLLTGAPMVEPATQIAVPMTEDVAKQQQELLMRLGVSLESAMLRQQIQSTVLVSDMQAFKAANPGSCLVDFIRWYSPKDWVAFDPLAGGGLLEASLPADGKGVWWFAGHGMLSERMRFGPSSEHIWQHMWETSAPVPASRQKRLFDPVQEAEKLFHYLETMSPHEMLHQALAGAIAGALFALETALVPVPTARLPVVHGALEELRACGNRAIAMLDEALAESEAAFSAAHKDEQERAQSQRQVAFEMALDACWKLVRGVECVEALVANALAVAQYFPREDVASEAERLELLNLLLEQALPDGLRTDGRARTSSRDMDRRISRLLQTTPAIRGRVAAIVLANPALGGPAEREYVLRCVCPRPFLRDYYAHADAEALDADDRDAASSVTEGGDGRGLPVGLEESPLVVNRMYAAFRKHTVRFALALAEAEF